MKPNILFICCDQQRFDCLGFNEKYPVKTPNLDRIAREGIQFNNSYTPLPTCCPARQSLLCGQRAERFGALWNYDMGIPVGSIQKDAFSWARELQNAGYRTGYVGKWHASPTLTPLDFGYEDYVPEGVFYRTMEEKYPDLHHTEGYMGEKSPYPLEVAPTHQNADHVISLIEKYGDEPWHIKMDFAEPHLPCRPSEPFASMYGDVPKWGAFDDPLTDKPYIQRQMRYNWETEELSFERCREMVKLYYGFISQVDDAIGRVIRVLEEKGILDDTLIIYTADHGDMCGDRKMMDKHYIMYEEVTKVPLVLRFPAQIAAGAVCEDMVTNMLDLVPTILEFAGLPRPEGLDGISLMPYLRGEEHPSPRRYALTTYNGQQFGLYTHRMIRDKKWKYVWNLTDVDELYDMENDPYELTNLAVRPEYKEKLRQMRLDMLEELTAVDDYTIRSYWLKEQLLYNRKP